MRSVILTFDVEDFINSISIISLKKILLLLKKYSINGIFFITGYMSEKIKTSPSIFELLLEHNIGYHSSSHSTRPIIPEYTDTKKYSTAITNSLNRETAFINPITGNTEYVGGILTLRELFSNKNIEAFRAPGLCWTPPHIEALKKLGIKYNFSSKIHINAIPSNDVLFFKGIKYFPQSYFIVRDGPVNKREYISPFLSLSHVLNKKITIYECHEWDFSISKPWDSIFYYSNPKKLNENQSLDKNDIIQRMNIFELFLRILKKLEKLKIIELISDIDKFPNRKIDGNMVNVTKTYCDSMNWCINRMNYKPKYLLSHFFSYFKK